jgi:hypothetical protein
MTETPNTPAPEESDLMDSAVEAVPSLDTIPPDDANVEDPDLMDSAVEGVPSLDMIPEDETAPDPPEMRDSATAAVPPDQSLSTVDPTPGQQIGHRLAAGLAEMTVPDARPTATRDLIHEMVQAGAEDEITPDLMRMELPPEEFTEADYAAYDAEVAGTER